MLYNKKHIYLRSPLRISFAGGGTDIEAFYSGGETGHVVSSTIDLFNYVSIKDMFDSNVRVHHAEIETQSITSRIKHPYAQTALEHYGIFKGAEVILTSDVMTTGSGLGASSAMMSSLLLGCSQLRDIKIKNKTEHSELTYKLEADAGDHHAGPGQGGRAGGVAPDQVAEDRGPEELAVVEGRHHGDRGVGWSRMRTTASFSWIWRTMARSPWSFSS